MNFGIVVFPAELVDLLTGVFPDRCCKVSILQIRIDNVNHNSITSQKVNRGESQQLVRSKFNHKSLFSYKECYIPGDQRYDKSYADGHLLLTWCVRKSICL